MKDAKVNKKVVQGIIVILLVISLCYLVLLHENEGEIKKIDLKNATQVTDFTWDIEELYFSPDSIHLKGVFYKDGESINYFNNRFLLRDKESGIVYELPTESFPKNKIVAEEDEMNYRNILSVAESSELDFVNKDYEILFLYDSNEHQLYQDTGYTVRSWGNKNED